MPLCITALLLAAPAPLHAQTRAQAPALPGLPPGAESRIGRYVELVVDDQGGGLAAGLFDLPFHPDVHTVVLCPDDIERARGFPEPDFQLDIRGRWAALFTTNPQVKADLQRNVTLFTGSISVGLMVRRVEDADDAVALAVVRRRSEVERRQAAVAALVTGAHTQLDRKVDQRADEKAVERFLAHGARVRPALVQGDVAPDLSLVHVSGAHAPAADRVGRLAVGCANCTAADRVGRLAIGCANCTASAIVLSDFEGMWWGDEDLLVSFMMTNTGESAFDWGKTQVFDEERRQDHAGAMHAQTPAIRVEGLVGRLPVGQHARGAVLVKRAKSLDGPMTILLTENDGARPVMATVGHWLPLQTQMQPQPSPTGWEIRPAQPPDPEKDKVSVHVQGVYGAVWLGDGTGADLSDATSLTGLGVRAQYAFNRYIAIEGELMGASTGTARFDDITYQGAQGELTRSAWLGRMQLGGVVRVGKGTYVPVVRLGVGLQGASHSGTLTTAVGEEPGPDEFEFDTVFTYGTGLDIRLSESFLIGMLLSGVQRFSTGFQAIEAGIHLGYVWKP